MTIDRLSEGGDVKALAAIHAQCFRDDPWSAEAIAELFAMPGAFAFAGNRGFVIARVAAGEAEILTLAVAPPAQKRGTGSALVIAAADHARRLGARSLFLEVAAGNLPARALYKKLGFIESGRRKGYYTKGRAAPEDAMVLRADLPLPPLGKNGRTG